MSTSSSNPYASPATRVNADPTIEAGVWRDGDFLVVRSRRHTLPDRCMICNAPSGPRRRALRLVWLSDKQRRQSTAILLLMGPWMFLFARSFAKSAKLRVGLCSRHLSLRRRAFLFRWLSVPIAIAAWAYCAEHRIGDSSLLAVIAVAGIAGVLYGVYLSPSLKPARIDRGFVWVKDVPSEYLMAIPELPSGDTD
jgi:hypothetical protein